jgi:membrane protein DedA with SNARE-associated domain
MLEWIENTITALGYPGIVGLMFLENIFPPIPSEIIMSFAGFTTTKGELTLAGVILAGTVGSVFSTLPFYILGWSVGSARLKLWADRYGRWLGVSGRDIERAQEWFDRHGGKAVFVCRLVPGIRSLISIPAGMARMNLASFLFYSTLGTGIWMAILAGLGRFLGENYHMVETYVGPLSYAVLAGIAVTVVWFVVVRRKRESERIAQNL